jgi:HK97 gp10 family phage protein
MAGEGLSIDFLGNKAIRKHFKSFPRKVQKRQVRKVVNAMGQPVVKAIRKETPVRSGALKKSLGKKVVTYKDDGHMALIIGPRADYITTWRGQKVRPVKYAHLVEFGFTFADSKKIHPKLRGKTVKGQHFMRKGFEGTQSQSMQAAQKKFKESIIKEARKQ